MTGTTVQSWRLAERLALSQQLLKTTNQPIDNVRALAGFGSTVSLRHHFRQAFCVTPSAWRTTSGSSLLLTAGVLASLLRRCDGSCDCAWQAKRERDCLKHVSVGIRAAAMQRLNGYAMGHA